MFIRLPARRHGWMALSSGSSELGTTRCSSKIIFWPRPWQTGHAPAGALKEKCFGVGGSKLLPVAGEHILFECRVSIHSPWRRASVPAVEGGILPPGTDVEFFTAVLLATVFSPGRMPGSTAGTDVCRHSSGNWCSVNITP